MNIIEIKSYQEEINRRKKRLVYKRIEKMRGQKIRTFYGTRLCIKKTT